MKHLYFDYASTTPVDPRVKRAMLPFLGNKFGNPSSLHSFGQEALRAVDEAREKIANLLGGNFREIIFTGSATEANNLALRGAVGFFRRFSRGIGHTSAPAAEVALRSRPYAEPSRRDSESFRPRIAEKHTPRIIVSAVEHKSVLETARDLERDGVEVVYLPVDRNGKILLNKLKQALNERTVLVSVMYANNELGTIQPITEIAKIISEFRNQKTENQKTSASHLLNSKFYILNSKSYPLFHTDAVQAFQYLDCRADYLGVDLITLSGHKIYGPKGIGVLYARNLSKAGYLLPVIAGGGQEFGLRSGTENVPFIVGMAEAAVLAAKARAKEIKRIAEIKNYFLRGLQKVYPKFEINGSADLPNILNLYFPDYPSDEFMSRIDMLGIAIGTGSACASRVPEASHVFRAAGFGEKRAKNSIRISFGRPTTKSEIDIFIKRIRYLLKE